MVVNLSVGAGNETQGLCKSGKSSLPLSHGSRSEIIIFNGHKVYILDHNLLEKICMENKERIKPIFVVKIIKPVSNMQFPIVALHKWNNYNSGEEKSKLLK